MLALSRAWPTYADYVMHVILPLAHANTNLLHGVQSAMPGGPPLSSAFMLNPHLGNAKRG